MAKSPKEMTFEDMCAQLEHVIKLKEFLSPEEDENSKFLYDLNILAEQAKTDEAKKKEFMIEFAYHFNPNQNNRTWRSGFNFFVPLVSKCQWLYQKTLDSASSPDFDEKTKFAAARLTDTGDQLKSECQACLDLVGDYVSTEDTTKVLVYYGDLNDLTIDSLEKCMDFNEKYDRAVEQSEKISDAIRKFLRLMGECKTMDEFITQQCPSANEETKRQVRELNLASLNYTCNNKNDKYEDSLARTKAHADILFASMALESAVEESQNNIEKKALKDTEKEESEYQDKANSPAVLAFVKSSRSLLGEVFSAYSSLQTDMERNIDQKQGSGREANVEFPIDLKFRSAVLEWMEDVLRKPNEHSATEFKQFRTNPNFNTLPQGIKTLLTKVEQHLKSVLQCDDREIISRKCNEELQNTQYNFNKGQPSFRRFF